MQNTIEEISAILNSTDSIFPVLGFDLTKQNTCSLDLSVNNSQLTSEVFISSESFQKFIDHCLEK